MTPEIKVKNDGKGKAQSYTAEIELISDNTYWGYFNAFFTGYGANEFSAKSQLIQNIDNLIKKLNEVKEQNK